MPRISVVMSVFNGADHLGATIDSILSQTEKDLEFIVVDDGSSDATPDLLRAAAQRDARMRIITQANCGLTRSLITGCAAAEAPLIARQDAGDLSHPERLERQAALFDRWPDLAFASSWVDFAGPELEYLYCSRDRGEALTPSRILDLTRERPLIDGPSHHGSVMFRRDAYLRVGGYRREFYYGQDWDLWCRLAEVGSFARLPETLYTARVLPTSITTAARVRQETLGDLSRDALRARQGGEPETAILAEAAAIGPVRGGTTRRTMAEGLYFIGEALRRNGDRRARRYLLRAIATWPVSPRAWLRLLQSLIL